jgi:O-antigen/teichoic acid export membrane protein
MLGASLRHLRARAESLLAIAGFGASSLFWLVLAFLMPAAEYGSMMTVQAPVLLVVAVFTFRTHDLVYYLASQRGLGIERSWRIAVTIEAVATLACIAMCAVGLTLFDIELPVTGHRGQVLLFGFLAALTVLQGATVAKLRYQQRANRIIVANWVCLGGWVLAGAALLWPEHPPLAMLSLGSLPQALRSLALLMQSRVAEADGGRASTSVPRNEIIRYLAGGQMINVVKNGATSIETMILAAFAPPAIIAMYRLAKSTLGVATSAANVAFQQGFAAIAKAQDQARRLVQLRLLNRRSLRIALASYPLSAAFALAYGLYKPEIEVLTFELIVLGVFIAFIPSVLIQGPFIVVTLSGENRTANFAYLLSLVVLGAISLILFAVPSVWIFIAATFLSALARHVFLSRRAAAMLAMGNGAHVGAGLEPHAVNS